MQWLKKMIGFTTPEEDELNLMREETRRLEKEKKKLEQSVESLKKELEVKESKMVIVDESILLQEFALYESRYRFQTLESFKNRLNNIRREQKFVLKKQEASVKETNWTVNGSKREGKKMTSDVAKLILRAFNSECEALTEKVKFNNIISAEQRMKKTFEMINRSGRTLGISISQEYLDLKLDELHLVHEYEVKKQEEKEELALKREQLREERQAMREIEAMKQKIEKEEQHFVQALESNQQRLLITTEEIKRKALEKKIKELEEKLAAVRKDKEDVLQREQNTRAGYVYIISNIGSFGENVYKIGVTRRLEPLDRVRELGDASVPFKFDVHAMIFSEDAPTLENELHHTFEEYRLNKLNKRREFFRVPLSKIESVVKRHHAKEVEFEELAYAEEFRQSLKMK